MRFRVVIEQVSFSSDSWNVQDYGDAEPRWVQGIHHTDINLRVVGFDASVEELVEAQQSGTVFELGESVGG